MSLWLSQSGTCPCLKVCLGTLQVRSLIHHNIFIIVFLHNNMVPHRVGGPKWCYCIFEDLGWLTRKCRLGRLEHSFGPPKSLTIWLVTMKNQSKPKKRPKVVQEKSRFSKRKSRIFPLIWKSRLCPEMKITYCTPPPHNLFSSPAGREIADSRHVFQNSVKSFMRVLSCNIVLMMGNYHF